MITDLKKQLDYEIIIDGTMCVDPMITVSHPNISFITGMLGMSHWRRSHYANDNACMTDLY